METAPGSGQFAIETDVPAHEETADDGDEGRSRAGQGGQQGAGVGGGGHRRTVSAGADTGGRYGATVPDRELTEAMLDIVRDRMEEQGLSMRGLAERSGLPYTNINRRLKGEGVIGLEEWDALAAALGDNRLEDLLEEARRRL